MTEAWDQPPTPQESETVERERAYWEEHEDLDWVEEQTKARVISMIPRIEGDVLELCIGSGTFTSAIPRTYSSYTGVDISRTLLDSLAVRMPDVIGVSSNAEELEFPDHSFDSVLTFAGLHHLPRYQRAMYESLRVLRPGGSFFCFEPNDRAWYRAPMRLMRDFIGIYSEDEVYLDPREVTRTMENLGFVDLALAYLTPRFKPEHLSSRNRVFARMLYTASAFGSGPFTQSFFALSGRKP